MNSEASFLQSTWSLHQNMMVQEFSIAIWEKQEIPEIGLENAVWDTLEGNCG